MSSSLLFAELAATCNAIGYSDGSKYYLDPHCHETIKDLIRFLRRDDENHEIRRYLGEAKILQSDLLPIWREHWEKTEMFDIILRLLVNLTNPALLLYREELPAEITSRNYYNQIIQYLQSYKEAFTDVKVWEILCKKLSELLEIEWQERGEEKGLIIERILVLIRNVLQVPSDAEAEKRPDNDANVHDQVLWALHQAGIVDVLLYIACSENEQQYYMHVLEIISLMLREQNATLLAEAAANRSIAEKERDEKELLSIRQRETEVKYKKMKKYTGTRFSGTYVLKNVKSISNEDLIYHKPIANLCALDLNHDKVKLKKPKNRVPVKGERIERRSALSIRLFLKEFCIEFLNGAYNTLMYHVKDGLVRAKGQANDESYYLWAVKFFMEFNRRYKFEMKLVSETMSLQAFHYVQTQLETYYEMMISDKKKIYLWSRRMHIALRAYQELLMTLMTMGRSNDPAVQESARVIKNNIFYVVEYRELILTLTINFDEVKMSWAYLKDLIETTHVFMKLLQKFCDGSRGIVVQQKFKERGVNKKKVSKSKPQSICEKSAEQMWAEIEPQISRILENPHDIPTNIVPFDAASETPMEFQKINAVTRIQVLLRKKSFQETLGLLRASREVWPENDNFGAANSTSEEELATLQDIFMADLGGLGPIKVNSTAAQDENMNDEEEDGDDDDDDKEEEEAQAARIAVSEQTFQFQDFARRFVHPRVVQSCSILLHRFQSNSTHTNHCMLKLLHRIAFDCKASAMLFQATIFRTFQRVLESTDPQHKELKKFAVYIIHNFMKVALVNKKVYMELLFWKSSRDAFDIENGYGSYQTQSHSAKQVWNEEEENELQVLYEEFSKLTEDSNKGDLVDWIMKNMINKDRSRRGVMKKLKDLGYDVKTKAARKSVKIQAPKEWGPEEEDQLTALYEQFKDAYDPLGCILARLTVCRSKARVVEKLLALGLVNDKKDLHKKRSKKSQSHGESADSDSEIVSGSGSDSDSNIPVAKAHHSKSGIPTKPKTPNPKTRKSEPRSKKASKVTRSYSSAETINLLKEVITAGMTEALQWLGDCIEECADDQEEETDSTSEGVPILPLTEVAIAAVNTPLFQKTMTALGLSSPNDGQEIYWRIPSRLNLADLRSAKGTIDKVIENASSSAIDFDRQIEETCRKIVSENIEDEDQQEEPTLNDNEEESLHMTPEILSGITHDTKKSDTNNKGSNHSLLDSDSETENGNPKSSNSIHTNSKKSKISSRNIIHSSDSEEEHVVAENDDLKNCSSVLEDSKYSSARKIIASSDSEEENLEADTTTVMSNKEEEMVTCISRKRTINSDSEDESVNNRKSRKVLLIDDDDDDN